MPEQAENEVFYNPFAELKKQFPAPPERPRKRSPARKARPASGSGASPHSASDPEAADSALFLGAVGPRQAPARARPEARSAADETDPLFMEAVRDVRPMQGKGRALPLPLRPERPGSEACRDESLADFLRGKFEFSLEYTDEFMEGRVLGLDPLIMAKLRAGRYSPEKHLDLHGLNAEQARERLLLFIRGAYNQGLRSLLVVTGRGLNSPGGLGILRGHMREWLTRDPLKRVVQAFCTAKPKDGGSGALYVLLRRYKKSNGKIRWDSAPTEENPLL